MFKPASSRTPRLLRTALLAVILLVFAVSALAQDQVSRREAYYQNLKILSEAYDRILGEIGLVHAQGVGLGGRCDDAKP